MNKTITVLTLCAMLFALCVFASAQQAKKVFRIGYLAISDPATDSHRAEAIRLALRGRGYVEGQNIVIESRHAEGKVDRAPELAAELVRLKVDVIVVPGGAPWIQAAKKATTTIPIVMMSGGSDPVEEGFVESLARPGGNVTGITTLSRELGGKRLELLKEAVPKAARVAYLYDPANPDSVRELKENLRALGLIIQSWAVPGTNDFDRVFAAMSKQRPDGLYMPAGPLLRSNQKRIIDFSLKIRLPSIGTREYVDGGGFIYYGADVADTYRRVAYFVDRILKGAKPADLPVEQPTKFEFVINLKTAQKLGLIIPPDLLARATTIIR